MSGERTYCDSIGGGEELDEGEKRRSCHTSLIRGRKYVAFSASRGCSKLRTRKKSRKELKHQAKVREVRECPQIKEQPNGVRSRRHS